MMKKALKKFMKKKDIVKDCAPVAPRKTSGLTEVTFEPPTQGTIDDRLSNEINTESVSDNDRNHQCLQPPVSSLRVETVKTSKKAQKLAKKDSKKNRINDFTINISNASEFHLGQQININTSNGSTVYIGSNMKCDTNKKTEIRSKVDSEMLKAVMDIDDKLTTADIVSISRNVNLEWRSVGDCLKVSKSRMDQLSVFYNNEISKIMSQILQDYLDDYPKTSLGFICWNLNKCKQFDALNKIIDNKMLNS